MPGGGASGSQEHAVNRLARRHGTVDLRARPNRLERLLCPRAVARTAEDSTSGGPVASPSTTVRHIVEIPRAAAAPERCARRCGRSGASAQTEASTGRARRSVGRDGACTANSLSGCGARKGCGCLRGAAGGITRETRPPRRGGAWRRDSPRYDHEPKLTVHALRDECCFTGTGRTASSLLLNGDVCITRSV